MIAAAFLLLRASAAKSRLLLGERPGDLLLEPAKLLLRLLQRSHRLVEIAFLGGGLLAQDVGPCAGVGHGLVDRRERLLGLGDLVGEGAVLLADIDVVGHLREQVGERATGQERLERRGPVGVVRAADAIGKLSPPLGELDALRGFLRHDPLELGVHRDELLHEVFVDGLDLVDLGRHPGDLLADRIEVGADLPELVLRVGDLRG